MSDGAGIPVFTAPAETVIVQIDDQAITVGDFRRRHDLECGVFRLGNEKKQDFEKRFEQFEARRLGNIFSQLVHNVLIERYLVREGVGLAVDGEEKIISRSLRKVSPQGSPALTLEALAKRCSVPADYIRRQILMPALDDKARLHFDPAYQEVSEADVKAESDRIASYVARATASNSVTRVTCSNALAQVRAGADFKETARKFGADDPGEAEEWGWYNREDLDRMPNRNEDFIKWVFSAKVGDIGGPYDLDDGLSIVKVVDHQDGTPYPSVASKQVEEVQLVRINFLMAEEHLEPQTPEHYRRIAAARKQELAQKRMFEHLLNTAKITYPHGDKLDFRKENKQDE